MKILIFIFAFIFLLISDCPGDDNVLNITSGGNFSVAISDGAGHYAPVLDFFRRFERIVRRFGRIEDSSAARQLLIVLDEKMLSGSCKFEHSRQYRKQVLKVPVDYRSLLNDPVSGRVLASALVQSRLGNLPQEPLPEAACWIADGLWAEFVHRENTGNQFVRFTWLPNLRNIVENGGRIQLAPQTLTPPENIRTDSAEWVFYCEKARLMLEVSQAISDSRSNLLKDYCFLLFGKLLTSDECFEQTFSVAAKRKLFTGLTPAEIVPADEKAAGRAALDRLTLKSLYSQYVPISPVAASRIFEKICKITFKSGNSNLETAASITDLPRLVEKYTSSVPLPRIKIFELNELTAIAPAQLRSDFYQLAFHLSQIGSEAPENISRQMKKTIENIRHKLRSLERVDAILGTMEKSFLPLGYEQRFFMNDNLRQAPLPQNIKSFIDTVERSLQR